MNQEVTLFMAGAVVALASSFFTSLFQYWLEIRKERKKLELQQKAERAGNLFRWQP